MKKIALFTFLCACALALAACGGKEPAVTGTQDPNTTTIQTTTPAPTSPPDSSPDGQSSSENGWTFTQAPVTSPDENSQASTTTPTAPPQTPPMTTVPVDPQSVKLSVPVPDFDLRGLTEAEAEAFFADAVFIGDSISLHWRSHVLNKRKQNADFFASAQFLTAASLGAANSLWPVSGDSVHPIYQGKQMQLWESIPLTGAKKVIIQFGLNDVAVYGVDKTVANVKTLIEKIQNAVPDASFYIISATYVQKGGEKGSLNSENLRKLNRALIEYCVADGVQFINLADALADSEGNLAPQYCNDNYVHHTAAAHAVWEKVLRGFAASQLKP